MPFIFYSEEDSEFERLVFQRDIWSIKTNVWRILQNEPEFQVGESILWLSTEGNQSKFLGYSELESKLLSHEYERTINTAFKVKNKKIFETPVMVTSKIQRSMNKFSLIRQNYRVIDNELFEKIRSMAQKESWIIPGGKKRFWWVNQGSTLKIEKEKGILWAPLKSKDNKIIGHWKILEELRVDDVVLHYARGFLRYISRVLKDPVEAKRPSDFKETYWDEQGRRVEVEYHELTPNIPLESFNNEVKNLNLPRGPIDKIGGVKQGYCFEVSDNVIQIIQKSVPEVKWPDFIPEADIEKLILNMNESLESLLLELNIQPVFMTFLVDKWHKMSKDMELTNVTGKNYFKEVYDNINYPYVEGDKKFYNPFATLSRTSDRMVNHKTLADHRHPRQYGCSHGEEDSILCEKTIEECDQLRAGLCSKPRRKGNIWVQNDSGAPYRFSESYLTTVFNETLNGEKKSLSKLLKVIYKNRKTNIDCALVKVFLKEFHWTAEEFEKFFENDIDELTEPSEQPMSVIETYNDVKDSLKVDKLGQDLEFEGLYFENENKLIQMISNALSTGKHLILIGPPGTGKSKLAKKICEFYCDKKYKMCIATSDWSTFETIGGYRLKKDGNLEFYPGLFLQCFQNRENRKSINEWLIIDEINRADIDKAFGSLFAALTGDDLVLPFERDEKTIEIIGNPKDDTKISQEKFVIPEDWRIIATMNTYDKASLYEMSYAFMRRFAFIPIDVPSEIDADLIKIYLEKWATSIDNQLCTNLAKIWKKINDTGRIIGPAIVEDMYKYILTTEDYIGAIVMFVLPQFEGIDEEKQNKFLEEIKSLEFISEEDFNVISRFALDFF